MAAVAVAIEHGDKMQDIYDVAKSGSKKAETNYGSMAAETSAGEGMMKTSYNVAEFWVVFAAGDAIVRGSKVIPPFY